MDGQIKHTELYLSSLIQESSLRAGTFRHRAEGLVYRVKLC